MSDSAGAASGGRTYLVYGENGMRLVYGGDDAAAFAQACAELSARSAGHISGYQFVGRERFELRAFFDPEPSEAFIAARFKRDLFDFAWHPGEPSKITGKGPTTA